MTPTGRYPASLTGHDSALLPQQEEEKISPGPVTAQPMRSCHNPANEKLLQPWPRAPAGQSTILISQGTSRLQLRSPVGAHMGGVQSTLLSLSLSLSPFLSKIKNISLGEGKNKGKGREGKKRKKKYQYIFKLQFPPTGSSFTEPLQYL